MPSGAQTNPFQPGGAPPLEMWSGLWNTLNNYRNTVTTANMGQQLDTAWASQTIYLTTATNTSGRVNADTFVTNFLNGSGRITFTASYLKAQRVATSVNPTINVTIQRSNDGVAWTTISGQSVATVIPTSSVTPTVITFELDKTARAYRLMNSVAGDTCSMRASYYFLRTNYYTKTY